MENALLFGHSALSHFHHHLQSSVTIQQRLHRLKLVAHESAGLEIAAISELNILYEIRRRSVLQLTELELRFKQCILHAKGKKFIQGGKIDVPACKGFMPRSRVRKYIYSAACINVISLTEIILRKKTFFLTTIHFRKYEILNYDTCRTSDVLVVPRCSFRL